MVELDLKTELYYRAHQLVDAYPDRAVTWFAVACYYYLLGKYETARSYFNKSTRMDPHFAAAWLGLGHAYAAQEESDPALAAYRTAARFFSGYS